MSHKKDSKGYTIYHSDGSTKDILSEHTPIIDNLALDNSDESINNFYNPAHTPSNTVKITKDNQTKNYDVRSKEYKDLYDSGNLTSYDKKTDTYYGAPLEEVNITEEKPDWMKRIDKQNEFIQNNKYESEYNYSIIDKKHNKIFYYKPNGELISDEQIITGQNNKDVDYSISMKDWFKDANNKNKSHEDYFDFLGKNESRITPSGHFTISSLNNEILDNPDKVGDFWNSLFNNERRKLIEENRKRDYGSQGKLLKLTDDYGVASSKAIHGTENTNRVSVLNNPSNFDKRDMSNGCINVKGKSICFETLKKGSSVYILPEESPELVTKKNEKISNGNIIKKSKSKIYNTLKEKGLDTSEDVINIISTIHGRESTFGTNKKISIEDSLPFFNSDGEFQINPNSFKNYLTKDYKNDFSNQVESVYNFIKKNPKLTMKELYKTYNSGSSKVLNSSKDENIEELFNKVSKIK